MTHEPSPEEAAAARLIADPGLVQRRLSADLQAVAALNRGHVRLDPSAGTEALVSQVRDTADRIGFESPLAAATLSKRFSVELPLSERSPHKIEAYHRAATRTLREGTLASDQPGSDRTRYLDFQRNAMEAGLVSLTLSARIHLVSDGSAWLDAFGWPNSPKRPVHTFAGSPEELISQAQRDLQAEDVPLERALLMLLGATLQSGNELDLTDTLRLQIAESVTNRRGELNICISRAEDYASASEDGPWYSACLYRSLLENVFEKFLGSATFDLIDEEELSELDNELSEKLPHAHTASASAVPARVPEGHWWWEMAITEHGSQP